MELQDSMPVFLQSIGKIQQCQTIRNLLNKVSSRDHHKACAEGKMMSTVTHQNDYFSLDNLVETHFSHLLFCCKESAELGHSTLHMLARAAIVNYLKLGDLNKKNSSPHSAGGWKPQIKG